MTTMDIGQRRNRTLMVCVAFVLGMGVTGCATTPSETAHTDSSEVALDVTGTTDAEERVCTGFFGQPADKTGLDTATCKPTCACGDDSFTFQNPTAAQLAAWESAPIPKMATPSADPYDASPAITPMPGVCGVRVSTDGSYALESAADEAELSKSGATLTHHGRCGLCSNLADLAVYARETDLTQPVRTCGLAHFSDLAGNVACLRKLGFTAPCAWIWAYNTRHTRKKCLEPCLAALSEPYHKPDGSLNACLQCDEDQSGPVFKTIAGRTRRNSGLASALCRPCDQVDRVEHNYALK